MGMGTLKQDIDRINALLDKTKRLLIAQEFDKAEKAAQEVISIDRRHVSAHRLLAKICEARGDREAAAHWEKIAALIQRRTLHRQVEAEARGHYGGLHDPGHIKPW